MLSASLRKLFGSLFSSDKPSTRTRRTASRRKLKLEQLENRQLLATDLATITGTVFADANDDGVFQSASETRLTSVTVELYLDDGDGVFEPGAGDGAAVATDTSDAQGLYEFAGLSAATYFVRQIAGSGTSSGLLLRDAVQVVTVSPTQAAGVTSTIDDYDTGLSGGGTQSITATPGNTDQSGAILSGVLGGERDLFIRNDGTSSGDITIEVDGAGAGADLLAFSIDNSTTGTLYAVYDGSADTLTAQKETVETTGLGGIDITEGGTRDAFQFFAQTDTNLGPVNLVLTVYDGTNQSSVTTAIPVNLTGQELIIPFSSFTGVDLTNLGALQVEIDTAVSADGSIEFAGTIGPTLITTDVANQLPMSLGDTVFLDLNNNGVQDSGEAGISGVVVQLFLDEDGDGLISGGEGPVLDGSSNPITDTTDASGNYLFTNLLPNSPTAGNPALSESYVVVISNAQGALTSLTTSTGNDVSGAAPDPNNNVDDDDNGTLSGANTVSTGIRLNAGAEPTTDGDTDPNTNLTLDFGFTPSIDVEIEKTGTATIDAGGNVTYTLTVTNNSPIAATNIVVTDDLPTGVTFVPNGTNGSTSSASWTEQANSSAELRATIASLGAGLTQTFTVVVSTDPTLAAGSIDNVATVTSDGIDTVPGNNSDNAPTTITRSAVLTLTKSDGTRSVVRPGDQFTYTLVVTNTGVSTANNVTLVDLLPDGYTFESFGSGSQGNPQVTDVGGLDQISAGVTSLAVGATMTVEVVVSVNTDIAGTTIVNTATADSDDSAAVQASDTNNIQRDLNLAITKTVSSATVGVGGQVTYTLSVTNEGPTAVTGVEVDDDLPTGFTLATTGNPSSVTNSPTASRDILYAVGSLAVDETKSVQIIIDVGTGVTPGDFVNTATIAIDRLTGFTDTDNTDDEATATVTVQPRFDLQITKDDGLTTVETGDRITYTLTINNDGPSAATNVVVTDALPAGLQFVSATSGGNNIGTATGQNFSATIASLASGETRTILLVADVRASATGTTIVNSSTVTADNAATQEEGTRPNTASDTDTLTRNVVLNITKSDSADPVLAGATFSYIVTAFNSGSADAPSVLFSDPLPTGVEFVSGTFTINETVPRTGTVTFNSTTNRLEANLGTLLANGTSTTDRALITLNVRAANNALGTLTNTATLTSPDETGVSDSETTLVNPSFDLTITKSDGLTTAAVGDTITYTIVVTNSGPSSASNITVTDVIPTGLTFASVSSTAGTFTNSSGTVSGNISTLASGASATITLTATVNSNVTNGTQISNTATVSVPSGSGETVTTNNSASDSVTVNTLTTISGFVYADINKNGVRESTDTPIEGVTIQLNGTVNGTAIATRTTTTDANGQYTFDGLAPGTYSVSQVQPNGFLDSTETVGSTGGTAGADLISGVPIAGVASTGNNFGEILPLSKRRFLASANPR